MPVSPAAPVSYPAGLMWFRRDLRSHDNAALYHALRTCAQVQGVFVFDRAILEALPRADRRVEFVRDSVQELVAALGGGVEVRHAFAADEIPRLARQLRVSAVFANHDDEPDALARDANVRRELETSGIAFHTFKDHAIFERRELQTRTGTPYTVFTPYKNAWLAKVDDFYVKAYAVERHIGSWARSEPQQLPSLEALGFQRTNLRELGIVPGAQGASKAFRDFLSRIDAYHQTRDHPSLNATSWLGVHLRFGTVSVRELAREALARAKAGSEGAAVWLAELVWRDFFIQILANFPHVVNGSFRREYDSIEWEQGARGDELFAAWCEGRTGYPIVDAGMAQLNATGFMHNRLRMIAASFLVKDFGVDWRRGERYFAQQLNDYELASNNGNWQWAASTGCDAQPYFRIFNPESQQKRFDAKGDFVRQWLPKNYDLLPIVDHAQARGRTLARYEAARKKNGA